MIHTSGFDVLARVAVAVLAVWLFVVGLEVWAQSVATPTPPMTSGAPQQVNGFVNMSSGLTVDGGTTLRDLEVTGNTTFRNRPVGVVLSGSIIRSTPLTVGVGCSTLGTTRVPGSLVADACTVSAIPPAALSLGLTYDCYVTTGDTVTLRGCGLVSLVAAPTGTYQVRIVGP